MADDDRHDRVVRSLLVAHGESFAHRAGITLRDTPSPLYRLLVLAHLLSARISSQIAVTTARELARSGFRTPRAVADASWQQLVDALGRGGYRRFDERTATQLRDGAGLLLQRWGGDLRRLHHDAGGDPGSVRARLQETPGVGPLGSAVFCREVQGVWRDLAPFVDDRVAAGARALRLPSSPRGIALLVPPADLPRLAAALVAVTLHAGAPAAVLQAARRPGGG